MIYGFVSIGDRGVEPEIEWQGTTWQTGRTVLENDAALVNRQTLPSWRIQKIQGFEISFCRQCAKSSAMVACDVRFLKTRAVTVLTRNSPGRSKTKPSAGAADDVVACET